MERGKIEGLSDIELLRAINNSEMPAHNTATPPVRIEAFFMGDPELRLTINGNDVGTLVISGERVVGLKPSMKAQFGLVEGVRAIIAAQKES